MLPGIRFLLAAIVLSMSILVFALGAAALLRAAHEEFASTPAWRVAPEPKFARQNEPAREALREEPMPVLAILRVEPEPVPPTATDSVPAAAAPAEPSAIAPVPDQPDKIAALEPQDKTPPEARSLRLRSRKFRCNAMRRPPTPLPALPPPPPLRKPGLQRRSRPCRRPPKPWRPRLNQRS